MKALLVVALLAASAEAEERLRDRMTLNTGMGIVGMEVDGVMTSGMHVQPAVTRTFDRFELHAEYMLGDLRDDSMPGATLHRFGLAARYQVRRWRDAGMGTVDLVAGGGIGQQYVVVEDGSAFGRSDVEVGIGMRMLAGFRAKRQGEYMYMGLELMVRGLVTPSGDKALLFAFSAAFGR